MPQWEYRWLSNWMEFEPRNPGPDQTWNWDDAVWKKQYQDEKGEIVVLDPETKIILCLNEMGSDGWEVFDCVTASYVEYDEKWKVHRNRVCSYSYLMRRQLPGLVQ